MTLKKISVLIPVLLSFFLISCSDDPSSIGVDLLNPDLINIEQVNSLDDPITQTSRSAISRIPLGASSRLLVGRHDNINASTLIRFSVAFHDSLKQQILSDSINVTSSWVELNRVYTFGNNDGVLDFDVLKILSQWSTQGFIADSLVNLQTSDLAVDPQITDSLTTFNLNSDLALEWLKIAADPALGSNWGIYLKPVENSTKVFGFQSLASNVDNIPVLRIVIDKPGVYTDTLVYYPLADISVVQEINPLPEGEYLTVQAGLRAISYINFDLSIIPRYAVINRAELILTSDTNMNITAGDTTNYLVLYSPADSANIDSISSATIELSQSGNTFSGNVTNIIQDWLNNQNNRGVVLTTRNSLNGLEKYIIWGSDAADPAIRPRLIITYTNKL